MTNAATLLNEVATKLNTTDKKLCINVAMAMLVKSGMKVDQAMDALLGEGAYKKFAGQVYDSLRAKAH